MTENESDLTSHKGKKKRSCMEVKKQLFTHAEVKATNLRHIIMLWSLKELENGRSILKKVSYNRGDNVLKKEGKKCDDKEVEAEMVH